MKLIASCAFGLEAIVARELQSMQLETQITSPGQIEFSGGWSEIANANLWLRSADRISISVLEFDCTDFDTLFETVKSNPWLDWFRVDANVHVTGSSVKSQLSSVPAIQRTVKKAIVESLLLHSDELPETGVKYRLHVALRDNVARLTLDTTGPSLHKRGYREIATRAPLKETLGAALVQLSFWRAGRPLIDPFCGGGTILIEAAMIGRNLAPGRNRTFASESWPQFPPEVWREAREQATSAIESEPLSVRLIGYDIHPGALSLARRNAEAAGVADDIHFQRGDFANLTSKREYGTIITNPPYGDRIESDELRQLYESMPLVLRGLPTWSHYIFTAYPNFEALIGKQADRRRKLYNGRIECTYYQFHGPKPGTKQQISDQSVEAEALNANGPRPVGEVAPQPASASSFTSEAQPAFGGPSPRLEEQKKIFANRLQKRARHLRRWPTKRGITCYRLYEKDIPEVPLIVDRYEDHLHIIELERPHDRDVAQHADWLDHMAATAADTLDMDRDNVHVKSRLRQRGSQQHEKLDDTAEEFVVHEGGLKFRVNLTDYTDTGLFLDHRNARAMVRDMSQGLRVLNLFAYTGAFSVYAADGGATTVTTVDWSQTYLKWARRNMHLNGFSDEQRYTFVRADAREFFQSLTEPVQFDLVVCDPPTFSNSKRTEHNWDVQRHHTLLLRELLAHTSPGGHILFSTNFRRIQFRDDQLPPNASVREITKQTLPEEYRNRRIHRSWLIQKAGG